DRRLEARHDLGGAHRQAALRRAMSAARAETWLFVAQRASAVVLAVCVAVHLAVIITAAQVGISAAAILGRTRGAFGWMAVYGLVRRGVGGARADRRARDPAREHALARAFARPRGPRLRAAAARARLARDREPGMVGPAAAASPIAAPARPPRAQASYLGF